MSLYLTILLSKYLIGGPIMIQIVQIRVHHQCLMKSPSLRLSLITIPSIAWTLHSTHQRYNRKIYGIPLQYFLYYYSHIRRERDEDINRCKGIPISFYDSFISISYILLFSYILPHSSHTNNKYKQYFPNINFPLKNIRIEELQTRNTHIFHSRSLRYSSGFQPFLSLSLLI